MSVALQLLAEMFEKKNNNRHRRKERFVGKAICMATTRRKREYVVVLWVNWPFKKASILTRILKQHQWIPILLAGDPFKETISVYNHLFRLNTAFDIHIKSPNLIR